MNCYGLDAELLPPPVAIQTSGRRVPVPGLEPGFLLTISRARGYKNADLLADAISRIPGERMVMVGGLPERPDGRAWPTSMVGVKDISDEQLRWLYANCSGLVAVSNEDFGLTPLEANSFGKPVACLRAGGYLDSLVPGVSGVFIEQLSAEAIAEGVRELRETTFDVAQILEHAEHYSEAAFAGRLQQLVAQNALVPASVTARVSTVDLDGLSLAPAATTAPGVGVTAPRVAASVRDAIPGPRAPRPDVR